MATIFICDRHTAAISRVMVLEKFPNATIGPDDVAKGKVRTDEGVQLGISDSGKWAWISFNDDDEVSHLETFGRNDDNAIEAFGDAFNVNMFSEHDDEFDYHNFPVDVNVATPYATKDYWQVFESDGWVYLYDSADKAFYAHICQEVNNYNLDDMIEEVGE